MYEGSSAGSQRSVLKRGARILPRADGLCNIPSSRFLRPYSTTLAAVELCVFHLNWHPHNFGLNLDQNMAVLRSILQSYRRHRDSHGHALSFDE